MVLINRFALIFDQMRVLLAWQHEGKISMNLAIALDNNTSSVKAVGIITLTYPTPYSATRISKASGWRCFRRLLLSIRVKGIRIVRSLFLDSLHVLTAHRLDDGKHLTAAEFLSTMTQGIQGTVSQQQGNLAKVQSRSYRKRIGVGIGKS